ncbi:mannose-1-phosphate guanylyltransferase/mannose-6-phosphate isomerase [Cellvibrio japonicus]|uniref:mannose-1-phosphate guanylyltransferase n=1 Tax=Cellvibrio japonicus (strain Ueda107) TaxID=498211 RepID=B3PIH5_CELJU|nr:mannose-1-phosphate guanylyltransferase/mannose-6-phosphate isomerase [Cellvibrio japonicus]ACE83761.1 mannose-1-phosphate guanylyltransferase/mannose-6-phosphate isomerase [Cellvibrio japonicus Ueda107]QEI12575.1 mannose-1-phosphate guanylyltransferase/mannose-6-phosphate isomerase [Cellvibrio japonicus]QEI16149.1 mannose-1-phosphate guanylyltransferase/mannose-6-phosphate isomerase [Cellvibrio japonicus]QEI19727.1 mannose-1-phosphate guanylyltransferase/mannose-6-phosphate isomerase [Cellv
MIIPVILAGGSGTRLWPLSRQHYPKQLLKLFGNYTMLQQTILRLSGLPELLSPIVVCNQEHRFMVAEQMQELGIADAKIILEPVGRNTAPALALAAMYAQEVEQSPTLLVLSADHMIRDVAAFQTAVDVAVRASRAGHLVTFGVTPTHPETGYGYIKTQAHNGQGDYLPVQQFVEKPDFITAQSYLAAGCYFWNSGMFVFQADIFLQELAVQTPDVVVTAEQAKTWATRDLDFIRVDRESFAAAPNISIDYALMEKSANVVCVPLDAGWSDVGDWKSYWELSDKDSAGNSFIGDSLDVGSTNTLVFSQDKLVATLGVDNLMIINTPDAVMVAHKSQAQQVKSLIGKIEKLKRTEHLQHREIYRPWGCYDVVDNGERYQVNRIRVKPGGSLSLQLHHHRAEHWIVVKGTALVQRGEDTMLLSENESTYIPVGVQHRLSNPGKIPLEIVEVQSGPYLEQDDVIRFEDSYGRS